MLVTQSDRGDKVHRLDFLGFFVAAFSLKWHPMSLYLSSKTKITSDVLRASLIINFSITGVYALKMH
jgi:hypothetical protein